ncbi:MAG: ADP-ribose diphosphatase [Alphaproteobacteria bacterium]|nr:ADP-ribose diphosphatase [Alphaproteobacteria bacterium]
MMTRDDVDILDTETVWKGFFRMDRLRLRHRLFGGGWGQPITREVFERGHAAALLPYDPVRDEVVLIEQFRTGALTAGAEPWLVEIVAGIIEDGETAEDVVRRETVEEAGCEVTDIVPIMDVFTTPGGSSERIAIFCGRVDARGIGGIHGLAGEGEDIRVFTESLDEALARLANGDITNIIAVAALQWLALNREKLRREWLAGGA